MIRRFAPILVLAAMPAAADVCGSGLVTIPKDTPWTERMCQTADRAVAELAACNLPLTQPVSVELDPDLPSSCVGLFHCDEGRIALLPPEKLDARKSDSRLFSPMDTDRYFDSILYHELVHAAYNVVDCPFDKGCPATAEYLAYAFQIRSLSDDDRADIGLADLPERTITRDEINAMYMFMAPGRFAAKAWTHLMQKPDPCAFVGQIAAGKFYFDNGQP